MSSESEEQAGTTTAKRPLARRVLRWVLVAWLLLLLILVPILVLRTVGFQSKQPLVQKVVVPLPDANAMAGRLARALQFETVSDEGSAVAGQAFYDLHQYLRVSFPLVHATLVRENIADYSLLYTWKGSVPELPALILAGHLDVVPAGQEPWTHAPFSGQIADGYIYGRGSLDDKVNVVGLLEAAEQLLREDFAPKRTIYLAFGHDEEMGGYQGAKAIAEILAARGVKAEAVVDEGMAITEGILEGLDVPAALIGVAEKGFVNVELLARGQGGHSSIPPKKTAIGTLSRAIVKLESNPMPASMDGTLEQMFRYIGPEFPFARKLVMANLWLFGRVVRSSLSNASITDALLRTTTAPTILESGVKSNVLAQTARAVVNFRVKPGDTAEEVLEHVRRVIDDNDVRVKAVESVEPQPSSSPDSRMFSILHRSVRGIDPSIVVAPGLVLGMTDSRHYRGIVDNTYRFSALRFGPDDLARVHGVDERVSIANYAELVAFQLLVLRAGAE